MSLLSDEQLQKYKKPLLLIACIQAFLGSGIFYGWAALYSLFLDAGVYRDACPSDEAVCPEQKEKLTFIYTGQQNTPTEREDDVYGFGFWRVDLNVLVTLSVCLCFCLLVASSVNLCSQLPWGCILDFLGPRVCNLWSTTLVIIGFVLLSLSSRGVIDGYMLAMCLIGGAGPGAQISLFHLSELFPLKQKSTVLSIVTGAFQLGFVVFMLFHLAYTYFHISVSNLALIYCVPLVILLLLGGVLWPDYPCIPPDDLDPLSFTSRRPSQPGTGLIVYSGKYGRLESISHPSTVSSSEIIPNWNQQAPMSFENDDNQREEGSPLGGSEEETQPIFRNVNATVQPEFGHVEGSYGSLPPSDSSSSPSLHYVHRSLHALRVSQSNPNLKGAAASKGFLSQVTAPSYLMCLLWMSICLFWANFYIGTVVEQLYVKSHFEVESTRHYTNIFTVCLPCGVLGIGIFGYLTGVLGFSTSIACTSLFAVGYAGCSLWLPLIWQPLTFVLYSFFRSFLFSVMFAYLANEFGYRHFGLLSGIMLAVGGALGFAQYPLERKLVVQDHTMASGNGNSGQSHTNDTSAFRLVNQLQFYTLLLTFYFAIYVFWRQRARAQRVEKQIQEHTNLLQTATSSANMNIL